MDRWKCQFTSILDIYTVHWKNKTIIITCSKIRHLIFHWQYIYLYMFSIQWGQWSLYKSRLGFYLYLISIMVPYPEGTFHWKVVSNWNLIQFFRSQNDPKTQKALRPKMASRPKMFLKSKTDLKTNVAIKTMKIDEQHINGYLIFSSFASLGAGRTQIGKIRPRLLRRNWRE